MQEEVENRTLTLIVSGTKFTGRLFKAAISKYMAHRKEKKLEKQRSRDSPVTPKGKQTVKQLIGQNQGVSNIEINDPSIRNFERIARKYGVDYAVKKDRSTSPPKYLIFFKGRDADALTAAFSEYTQKKVKKADRSERPPVLEKLAAPERLRGHIVNDMDVCICCGMCARRCPAGALAVDRKGGTWSIDPYACVVCGECIESCPKHCLIMDTARTPVAANKTPTVETKPE